MQNLHHYSQCNFTPPSWFNLAVISFVCYLRLLDFILKPAVYLRIYSVWKYMLAQDKLASAVLRNTVTTLLKHVLFASESGSAEGWQKGVLSGWQNSAQHNSSCVALHCWLAPGKRLYTILCCFGCAALGSVSINQQPRRWWACVSSGGMPVSQNPSFPCSISGI